MEIQVQRRKADEVLSKLKDLCPCFVAGGAPANWYQGLEANDIDVFVTYPHPDQLSLEEALGVKLEPLTEETYEDSQFTGYEWEDEDGQKFQILLHKLHTLEEVFDNFPLSICKAAYLGDGEYRYGGLFELSIRHKFVQDTMRDCSPDFYEKKRKQYSWVDDWVWYAGSSRTVLSCLGRLWQSMYTSGT